VRLLWASALALAACSKDVTADFDRFAERACACTDVACARAVLADFEAFAKGVQGHARGDEARTNAAAEKLARCSVKLGVSPKELMKLADSLAE
jgi:hypothetical protein